MEYYLNNLNDSSFQRLINGILVTRFGEDARLTPLQGADGGRDGETAPLNPNFEYQITDAPSYDPNRGPRKGRYLFQVKFHKTTDVRLTDARQRVLADFENELIHNVLNRQGAERVNYFFLITNVPCSGSALAELDRRRAKLLKSFANLHADIWWQESVITYLDLIPAIWVAFPEIFPGGKVPLLSEIVKKGEGHLPRALRLALESQYRRDSNVRFRQIELESRLAKLFVDIDIKTDHLPPSYRQALYHALKKESIPDRATPNEYDRALLPSSQDVYSALTFLIREPDVQFLPASYRSSAKKIILEGGPGQGKSTITQTVAQIYRAQLLGKTELSHEKWWIMPSTIRLPFRIELRDFAEFIMREPDPSVEEYLANQIKTNSGNNPVTVNDIQSLVENTPVLLIFDGLDEVASDEQRRLVLEKITDCIQRFEDTLTCDLRVILTTRPPAIAGYQNELLGFTRFPIAPLTPNRITSYVARWIAAQISDVTDQSDVKAAFNKRKGEPHVAALINNPMQLSVLLHFIRIEGEAFPDRRAELYRSYFQIVINRDVEKSPDLRKQRPIIEALHQFLGYKLHALTEAGQADGTLDRTKLLKLVETWLQSRGSAPHKSLELFTLGEERLGLIVALRGEGETTVYGYEVQPIREYFAAAYINEQISGNAHTVFQSLFHRPYWREVALFLAGLSKPNEKADLISRVRADTKQAEASWRQDGRAILLQLLQEGVFSDPPYIFEEALNLVIDLLDTNKTRTQLELPHLIEWLPGLILQSESKHGAENSPKQRIKKLLNTLSHSDDEYSIYRIYTIGRQLLGTKEMIQFSKDYKGEKQETLAKIRLSWPFRSGINIQEWTSEQSYWTGIKPAIWAEEWLKAAIRSNIATSLRAPIHLHQWLAVYFVAYHSYSEQFPPKNRTSFNSYSNWAVWRLVSLQQQFMYPSRDTKGSEDAVTSHIKVDNLVYDGLDSQLSSAIKMLIEVTEDLVLALKSGQENAAPQVHKYIKILSEIYTYPGLASWIAWRCTLPLLSNLPALIMTYLQTSVPVTSVKRTTGVFISYNGGVIDEYIRSDKQLSQVLQEFMIFSSADENIVEGADTSELLDEIINLSMHRYPFYMFEKIPFKLRPTINGKLTTIVKLLTQAPGAPLSDYNWLAEIPYPSDIIHLLFGYYGEDHVAFLRKLAGLKISTGKPTTPFPTSTAQKIFKLARQTEDAEILTGTLKAISCSNFIRLAGPSLLRKLFRANRDNPLYAIWIFRRPSSERELPSSDKGTLRQMTETLIETANLILQEPAEFAFEVVQTACQFLADNLPSMLPPLLEQEAELDINLPKP